jgi:ATP-binding cassette subfamily B protein
MYLPDSGEVIIGGNNTMDMGSENTRKCISYVPQEPILFHRSIKENIAYANPDASDELIEKVSKQAHCMEFIIKLSEGFDSKVGDKGVKLSGGQRQRIAIARAILKDSPVLIFDEATSALDSESEGIIQDALKNVMKNKTSIVIAHRLSTLKHMDRIIVIDNGQVVEDGTHPDLLGKDGIYAKLWNQQSGGFLQD